MRRVDDNRILPPSLDASSASEIAARADVDMRVIYGCFAILRIWALAAARRRLRRTTMIGERCPIDIAGKCARILSRRNERRII